jgi:Acetyltransferase (GNAT) domain
MPSSHNIVIDRTIKIESQCCKNIKLRLVSTDDASFILQLRLDKKLNKYISHVYNDIEAQIEWIVNYKKRESQNNEFYFAITSYDDEAFGTVRLYDFIDDSFCWGSWVIGINAPISAGIESALSIYDLAFYRLGFKQSHFDVRKENISVVKFHLNFGAKVISEDNINYYFNFKKEDYEKIKIKYIKFLK